MKGKGACRGFMRRPPPGQNWGGLQSPSRFSGCDTRSPQKLPRQGNDGFTRTTPGLDVLIESPQARAIALCDQGALYKRRPAEFIAAFRNPAGVFGLVGMGDPRHDAEVSRQFAFCLEIVDVADHAQQNDATQRPDAFDTSEILVPLSFTARVSNRLLQFCDTFVQAADLLYDDSQLQLGDRA